MIAKVAVTHGLIAFSFLSLPDSAARSQESRPAFEVASIRPHPGLAMVVGINVSGSRITISAHALQGLILTAYELEGYQLYGGPQWMDEERYDIEARAGGEAPPTPIQVRLMLQTLIADRFQLKFHRETKQLSEYELRVAKGGPKLKASAPGSVNSLRFGGGESVSVLTVTGGGMEQLAKQLGNSGLERPVLDKTGLTGQYDYELRWSVDQAGAGRADGPPSVVTAIQEQLGLKLESIKGPVEIFVIDHAERPSGN